MLGGILESTNPARREIREVSAANEDYENRLIEISMSLALKIILGWRRIVALKYFLKCLQALIEVAPRRK